MKKTIALGATLVLTLLALTGCGCRNYAMPTSEPTTMPTTLPTTAPTTAPTTQPTTSPTTQPTTMATEPSIDYGNGPLTEATESNIK